MNAIGSRLQSKLKIHHAFRNLSSRDLPNLAIADRCGQSARFEGGGNKLHGHCERAIGRIPNRQSCILPRPPPLLAVVMFEREPPVLSVYMQFIR